MFISHPPRQTRHKRLVGARTATPYAPTRQRDTDAPQGVLGGNGAIVAGQFPAKVLSAEAACAHRPRS